MPWCYRIQDTSTYCGQPVPELFGKNSSNISLTYAVRKNNIILYKQNRYQVPKGTYSPGKELKLMIKGSKMNIVDFDTGVLIASHQVSTRQGELIKITHPERDIHSSIDQVYERLFSALGKTDNAKILLDSIQREKSRYCKDQFGLMLNIVHSYEASLIEQALNYCVIRNLWSAGMFKETLEYLAIEAAEKVDEKSVINKFSIPSKYIGLKPEVRSISDYIDALKEDKHSWKN